MAPPSASSGSRLRNVTVVMLTTLRKNSDRDESNDCRYLTYGSHHLISMAVRDVMAFRLSWPEARKQTG